MQFLHYCEFYSEVRFLGLDVTVVVPLREPLAEEDEPST
jgi:hypothetical protein